MPFRLGWNMLLSSAEVGKSGSLTLILGFIRLVAATSSSVFLSRSFITDLHYQEYLSTKKTRVLLGCADWTFRKQSSTAVKLKELRGTFGT